MPPIPITYAHGIPEQMRAQAAALYDAAFAINFVFMDGRSVPTNCYADAINVN